MLIRCGLWDEFAAAVLAHPRLEQDELAAVGTAAMGARGGPVGGAAAEVVQGHVGRDGEEQGDGRPRCSREVQQNHDNGHFLPAAAVVCSS